MATSTLSPKEREGLSERLKWLIVFRLAIATILALGTLIVRPGGDNNLFGPSFVAVLVLTLGHLAIAIAIGLIYRYIVIERLSYFAFGQIIWDLIFATGLIYISGGIDSEFKFMYWLTIINASILLFRKGAFASAALSGIFYGTLIDLEYFRIVPRFFELSSEGNLWLETKVISSIVLNIAVFFAVAYVSSWVSVRLRQTEQLLAETSHSLEDLELLMGRIVESLTSGLATLDADGKVSFWSRAAEEITGFRWDDLRGKKFLDIFPDAKGKLIGDAGMKSRDSQPWRWEMKFLPANGMERTLGFSVSPLREKEKGRPGTMIIFQDLTRYREMEEQVKRADRLAAVGELAARMAHEIRNPLTSISGAIEVLGGETALKEKDQRLMQIVLRETDRLNQLLTDFLIFAKPNMPQFEEVGIDQLLQETSDLFSKSLGDRGAKVVLELEQGVTLQGDPKHLSQMLWNLLKNAQEALGGKGEIHVALKKGARESVTTIEIRDRGPGIPANLMDRIFQPFVTTKARGTGLGLAMVRRIVEEHGGSISVESAPGEGTTFRVKLPVEQQVAFSSLGAA